MAWDPQFRARNAGMIEDVRRVYLPALIRFQRDSKRANAAQPSGAAAPQRALVPAPQPGCELGPPVGGGLSEGHASCAERGLIEAQASTEALAAKGLSMAGAVGVPPVGPLDVRALAVSAPPPGPAEPAAVPAVSGLVVAQRSPQQRPDRPRRQLRRRRLRLQRPHQRRHGLRRSLVCTKFTDSFWGRFRQQVLQRQLRLRPRQRSRRRRLRSPRRRPDRLQRRLQPRRRRRHPRMQVRRLQRRPP